MAGGVEIDILTLFPEMFEWALACSTLRIALEKGLLRCRLTDVRDYSTDPHRKVDDRPFRDPGEAQQTNLPGEAAEQLAVAAPREQQAERNRHDKRRQ